MNASVQDLPPAPRENLATPAGQRGVVLFIALIVLIAMTLASIALFRSVDTGTLVAGNLGFKQAAVQSGDRGTEVALQWLVANKASAVLNADSGGDGYYATKQTAIDLTGNRTAAASDNVDWGGADAGLIVKAKAIAGGPDAAGNSVAYIVHRLCTNPEPVGQATNSCATVETDGDGETKGDKGYDGGGGQPKAKQVYYRITTRIAGPKNTATYIQTFVTI